ncbi:hypothetical protein Tco_1335723 [Tanacetum coccineum]
MSAVTSNYSELNPCYDFNPFGFDQPPQYSINHQPPSIQENLNQQKMYELLQMMQSFCEKLLQQKQAASINQSPLQKISIQDMEVLKQHYLDEMLSLSKFNGMSIEINKKKELQHLEQVANLSTYPSQRFNSFYDDDDYEESTIPLNEIVSQNIESKDSYVSNLDDPALLVTPLFDFNEDECFDPGGDVDEITLLLHRDPSTPKMSVASTL